MSTSRLRWLDAGAYLFDIDGTLLNSRDAVHYHAFHAALRQVFGIDTPIDGVPLHGNTDPGILRAVCARAAKPDAEFDSGLPRALALMRSEVERSAHALSPQVCAGVSELLAWLAARGKLLGVVSGNLERIGWLKLETAGLRPFFAFGSFSDRNEQREAIFRAGVDEVRRRLGREEAAVVIVGDTPADIRAAQAVGVPVVALASGTYPLAQLAEHGPDLCLAGCGDLLATV